VNDLRGSLRKRIRNGFRISYRKSFRKSFRTGFWVCLLTTVLSTIGCNETKGVSAVDDPKTEPDRPTPPRGFPPLPYPDDNPPTAAKIGLGRRLFYDSALSRDRTVSCATCHKQNGSFCDPGRSFTFGIDGHSTARNSPSLANVAYNLSYFADGNAPTLEAQAIAPILNPLEMDMDTNRLTERLAASAAYPELFRKAFGDSAIRIRRVTQAIASFERSLLSGDSPQDRFLAGDGNALSEAAKRGSALFSGSKAGCVQCHGGFNFTDNGFHNTGLDSLDLDPGRNAVTGLPADSGKFKTPSLRNIALTPPYMHDGRFNSLREVMVHYNKGGVYNPNRDPLIKPLGLDEGEIGDLIAFLESLSDTAFAVNPDFSDPARRRLRPFVLLRIL